MSRANQWFVPGDGIAREVITADIQRYLGPDALVRPGAGNGEYEGRPGYWITAYRTLTSQMIQDLKMDSQRWQAEQGRQEAGRGGSPYVRESKVSRQPDSSLVAYQDSRTHAARQHWGPSESYSAGGGGGSSGGGGSREPARTQHNTSPYGTTSEHYTTTTSPQYSTTHPAYGQTPQGYAPRTQPDPYSAYGTQPGREHATYSTQPAYSYSQPVVQDPYRAQPPPPTQAYVQPSATAAPGYYIASDGRQYPLAQQPRPSGRRPAA